jgi:hypothetical protein
MRIAAWRSVYRVLAEWCTERELVEGEALATGVDNPGPRVSVNLSAHTFIAGTLWTLLSSVTVPTITATRLSYTPAVRK